MIEIESKSQLGELPKLLEAVRTQAKEFGLSEQALYEFEVASEEAIVNVMLYAYPESVGPMLLEISKEGDAFVLTIKDRGIAFDPTLDPPKVEADAPLEMRDEGGLGIYFMFAYSTKLSYKREDGWNILRLERDRKEPDAF